MKPLPAPYPYFGGKRRVAPLVWERLGDVANYVEPFFGSGAVLLARPHAPRLETINDRDALVSNFWRAVQADPEAVARWADWPVNGVDLTARHAWLVARQADLKARLEGNPDAYDAKIAGWWVWGLCSWIGSGWCSGEGPWMAVDGQLVNRKNSHGDGLGVKRKKPHLGNSGQGINRQQPHLGDAGRGVNRERALVDYLQALARRLRPVRVCCGDWSFVVGPAVTHQNGLTGVFLDPEYPSTEHEIRYAATRRDGEKETWEEVTQWAIAHGNDPRLRIAVCSYETIAPLFPADWACVAWKTAGGYGSQGQGRGRRNAARECIYFSPHCLNGVQKTLF